MLVDIWRLYRRYISRYKGVFSELCKQESAFKVQKMKVLVFYLYFAETEPIFGHFGFHKSKNKKIFLKEYKVRNSQPGWSQWQVPINCKIKIHPYCLTNLSMISCIMTSQFRKPMTPKKCMSIAKSLTNHQNVKLEPLCTGSKNLFFMPALW